MSPARAERDPHPGTPGPGAGLAVAREALGEHGWLVGGAIRDRSLGRASVDIDVVVEGDPAVAARAVARAGGRAACFALSEEFGSWRVVARDRSWQIDVEPLRGASIAEDLALRDFTVNAIAEPLAGGPPIDPLGGLGDLAGGHLRMAGPRAFVDDPLRVLRLVRTTVELGLQPDREALVAASAEASALAGVSAERVFAELRRIVASADVRAGLDLLSRVGAMAIVLPELEALRGVEQNRFHHLDVHGHTLEVLDRVLELTGAAPRMPELSRAVAASAGQVAKLLAEPLADEMSRGEALRWGALLHDAAKPLTRETAPADGRVTFIGHDVRGAQLAREVLARLRASERLRAHVAGLVRNHLRAGFLVHEPQPLSRETVFAYMRACSPVEADVTLLSIADRIATRGERAEESIARHLALTGDLLADALAWREHGPPRRLVGGDELASELAIAPGPQLGELIERLAEAQYSGRIHDRAGALAYARRLVDTHQA
jgi:poly(A) polymerase